MQRCGSSLQVSGPAMASQSSVQGDRAALRTSSRGKPNSSRLDFSDSGDEKGDTEDLNKVEKLQWKMKAELAVHIIPLILLTCVFVLYICSTIPTEDEALTKPNMPYLQQSESLKKEQHLQQAKGLSFNSKLEGERLDLKREKPRGRYLRGN